MMYEHTPQIPVATQENSNILKISNDFFEVRHDKNAGGTPVSILFKNGSGSNFLEKPVSAHAALKKDGQVVFYRQCNGKADAFSFEQKGDSIVIGGLEYLYAEEDEDTAQSIADIISKESPADPQAPTGGVTFYILACVAFGLVIFLLVWVVRTFRKKA